MRIKSDFHDYYDSVQAQGQDQSLLYLRKEEELRYERGQGWPFPRMGVHRYWLTKPLSVDDIIIGFCGKIYPLVKVNKSGCYGSDTNPVICYTLEEVDAYIDANFKKRQLEGYYDKKNRYSRNWSHYARHCDFEQFFQQCNDCKGRFENLFLEHRAPLFVGKENGRHGDMVITFNAPLKEWDFFRLFDTYTAFQEITMFLGGIAVPLKPIPDIPDKIMVGIKGFDEWSFRKPPREKST